MARREEAFAHDPEGGERGEQAVGMAASQYGAAERGAHTRPAQSRAWALGAVVMTCALVATAHMTQHPTAAAELVARGRKALVGQALKMDPPDDYVVKKSSFTKGEAHMINDVFNEESSKEELTDPVYSLVHPELLLELQKEIEREMEEEVQAAVKKEQQEYYLRTTATIQKEMGAVMDDVDKQKTINAKFHAMVKRAKELESGICAGGSLRCDNWDALLAAAQKRVDALKKQLDDAQGEHTADEAADHQKDEDEAALVDSEEQKAIKMEEELNYWKGLANVWIIKTPNPNIVLRFPNVQLKGADSRVSIFVGPENVELYKHEDVVNWASAYKSFTGSAYPAPIVCPSNEVLVIYQTAGSDAGKSELDMTWASGIEASAIAHIDDALASSTKQQLAEVKSKEKK